MKYLCPIFKAVTVDVLTVIKNQFLVVLLYNYKLQSILILTETCQNLKKKITEIRISIISPLLNCYTRKHTATELSARTERSGQHTEAQEKSNIQVIVLKATGFSKHYSFIYSGTNCQ